ncbi:hypothetical protein ACFQU9_14415 [Actinomadura namibiensis]|uniref:hypothetical protein n=1 Tax=Actinomadura kijaniata TaxID=46161 RepID=UPI001C71E700|nr:hypothetical protein [Actinomadura namibiensis]
MAINLGDAADAFLPTHRVANDNTRRAYALAIDRTIAAGGGRDRLLADVTDTGEALTALWSGRPSDLEPQSGRCRLLADPAHYREEGDCPAAR